MHFQKKLKNSNWSRFPNLQKKIKKVAIVKRVNVKKNIVNVSMEEGIATDIVNAITAPTQEIINLNLKTMIL